MIDMDALNVVLSNIEYKGWWFRYGLMGEGFYVQVCFLDGTILQQGRKWYISRHAVPQEVVQTVLKAILTAEEHEAREKFLYNGKRIYGPHISLEALERAAPFVEVREMVP